ncbi:uncharacterized protein LOC132741206 isoform X2 [Ruditapes philippinarum]|nr:uncharacterized protein LOC132741206 isoform X2 [Ruditapes philippinarum]
MDAAEHPHVFPTWELYPRVNYFRSRYLDFNQRFERVMKALPERFHMKAPSAASREKLIQTLQNKLHVMVLGEEDLSPSLLTVSPEVLSRYLDLPYTATEEIHVCVCYVKEKDLYEATLKDIPSVLNYLSTTLLNRVSFISDTFIVCKTKFSLPDAETDSFRKDILDLVPKAIDTCLLPDQILIGENVSGLSSSISKSLEKQIMDGFLEVFSFLQTFLRTDKKIDLENSDILKSETVTCAILDLLRNGHHLNDSKAVAENDDNDANLEQAIKALSNRIMCAAVSPMASKQNIPDWICHGLLEEISFEKDLQKSITSITRHHLMKPCDNALELAKLKTEGKYVEETGTSKCINYDFILHLLRKDLAEPVMSAEKKLAAMNQLTIVMKKMIFELKGYLKQTIVDIEIIEIGPRDLTSNDIPDILRTEIMGTEGVYGMGILYGQLEIHLKTDLLANVIPNVKSSISEILKRHRFLYAYTIKTIEETPKAFAKDMDFNESGQTVDETFQDFDLNESGQTVDDTTQAVAREFNESGQKLLSPFPDDEESIREGTLACFIKDSENIIYAVTCAHVVHPHDKKWHEVYIRTQNHLFGYSSSAMTLNVNESNIPFADIAAIKVSQDNLNMCSFYFQDEFGNNKIGRIATEQSRDLVGSYVFKYGASTGCSRGIIASNSYFSFTLPNHVVLVEPLPIVSKGLFTAMKNDQSRTLTQESIGSSPPLTQEYNLPGLIESSSPVTQEDMLPSLIESSAPVTQEDILLGLVELPSPPKPEDDIQISQDIINTLDISGSDTSNVFDISDLTCVGQAAASSIDDVMSLEKSSRSFVFLPRPEQQNGQDIHDSELGDARNTNEILSQPLSSKPSYNSQVFATHGDSGAVVCRRNLQTNEIELVSMVTAGDLILKDPSESGSESKKCISINMKEVLDTLREHCGKNFVLC